MVDKDSLELEVANFGPIVDGRIDLRPLTVFVGPSNTGKSYLAILIYALHRFFASGMSGRMRDGILLASEPKILEEKITGLSEWAREFFRGTKISGADTPVRDLSLRGFGPTENSLAIPPQITEAIETIMGNQASALAKEITRCFGTAELSDLIRKGKSERAGVTLRKPSSEARPAKFKHDLSLKPLKLDFVFPDELSLVPPDEISLSSIFFELWDLEEVLQDSKRNRQLAASRTEFAYRYTGLLHSLIDPMLPHIVGTLHRRAYYLPADRTGVMHAHNVVVSALIERASMAGLRQAPKTPTLSGVLADFLEQLIGIDSNPHPRRKSRTTLVGQIEDAILQGAVQMETGEAAGYPRFTYRPEGWRESLPLMNASSMVSELAPVVLFLRHLVEPGDLLIIEEPESHLHPAMQVEFTRQIAGLVRAGIRVLVTTHSEWVLEELSNVVLASAVPKSRREAAKDNGVALKRSEVGVWAFKPNKRPKGTKIEEIQLSASGDLYSASFDDVSVETYNKWVRLGNLVGDDA